MATQTSRSMRENDLFMRNSYDGCGRWEIPLVKKQDIPMDDLDLISCADAKLHESGRNRQKGVHFFVDDYRFENIYRNPEKSLEKYAQYAFLLTPDFSTYADMSQWRQLESVAKNRWCGAYWQSRGLLVVPAISWSTPISYDFCFDGVEKGSTVAVGMIGCKGNKTGFMRGYNEMLNRIQPDKIICYGTPFPEMQGDIIVVNYNNYKKAV